MGHIVNPQREYQLLQKQMDHFITTAPESPILLEILKMLFTPEEANLARQLPTCPTPLSKLSKKLKMEPQALEDKLSELALRGLVVDVKKGQERFFALAPVLGGIFEFIMMRIRDNLPVPQLAELFDQYIKKNQNFIYASFDTKYPFARAFVREESLPDEKEVSTEVLDWERVSKIIETASNVSVGLCACRHNNQHLGKACSNPLETCISINGGADAMIQMKISKQITTKDAMNIVENCKKHQLVQIGDNVQQGVTFLCNCCSCCCSLINAIRTCNIKHAIKTSNWVMSVDKEKCKGCGKCTAVCPVQAIELKKVKELDNQPSTADVDDTLCLGCGVCSTVCKSGAINMKPRPQRVLPPETAFERMVQRAVERGVLSDLILENPEKLSYRAFAYILSVLEKTSAGKALYSIKPLNSIFFNQAIKILRSE
ncbi:MAG TPA: 4Fe-4S binding protein [Candidatus Hydrogenedens sp.]|nr:4Fe-4S binding protein [Candidatus Hydrogenedens sp.]HOK09588.1 4Fe-4S binding protein [Candidatus Hydrogenedens sp.]HOL18824.1 4Fe-4S binding protein [Candidatus Hydrogenedens sp.]HPP59292.1 4Fe-4S binding protein [Candidatus Hydrogenedens sp.]